MPGYIPRDGLGPSEAIQAIRAAGGLPALAHFADAPDRTPLLRELMDEGLAGLEVYYRTFDRPTTAAMARTAAALGLVPTGGTDYHGDTRHLRGGPCPAVGPARGGRRTPATTAPEVVSRRLRLGPLRP